MNSLLETPADIWTPAGELTAVPPAANDNRAEGVGRPLIEMAARLPAVVRLVPRMPAKCQKCDGMGYLDYAAWCMEPCDCDGGLVAPVPALPPLVGITGLRNVGKSTLAGILKQLGYARAHAFDGGKQAAETYFRYVTGSADRAHRMVYGDLKDQPCVELPGGVAPRHFLEKFGHFMGDEMGVEWTLGMEVARLRREHPGKPIVVESLVYEAAWFRRQGGRIVRLVRPDHEGPAGVESDSVQAGIIADAVIENDGSIADLQAKVRQALDGWG